MSVTDVRNGSANRIKEFLSGAYYALMILIAMIGLVIWTVRQEGRISQLEIEHRDIDQKIGNLEQHGTRTMAERISVLNEQLQSLDRREQATTVSFDQRFINMSARLTEHDAVVRRFEVIAARQEDVLRRLTELEKRGGK